MTLSDDVGGVGQDASRIRGVLGALVMAAAVLGCGSSTPAATDTPTLVTPPPTHSTTLAPTAAPSQSAAITPAPSAGAWARIADIPAFRSETSLRLNGVSSGPDGLVAVGTFDSTTLTDAGWQTKFRAGVWTSPDGRAWQRYPDHPGFDGFSLNRVVALPDGDIIAVGYGVDPNRAVIVRGHDGKFGPFEDGSWKGARIFDIAAFDGGFAAVGGTVGGNSAGAVVWLSADGWTWNRRNLSAPTPFTAIASSARGLIAAGSVGRASAPSEANTTFWLSRDGRAWDEAGAIPQSRVFAILDDGAGYFAAGWISASGRPEAAAWSSSDGKRWLQMPSPASPGTLTALTSTADAIVAVGDDLGDPSTSLVWISKDGTQWAGLMDPSFEDASIQSITSTVDGVVAVGRKGPFDDAQPLILLWPRE